MQTVPALHFCKLAARKQKSKPADPASNNNFLFRASPFATFFFGRHFFMGCNVGIGLSGATTPPQNRLEINADQNSLNTYTGVGGSGLKFRQLTENSTFINNNATNTVLSVDNVGNVILVKDNSGGGGIGTCALPWKLYLVVIVHYLVSQHSQGRQM